MSLFEPLLDVHQSRHVSSTTQRRSSHLQVVQMEPIDLHHPFSMTTVETHLNAFTETVQKFGQPFLYDLVIPETGAEACKSFPYVGFCNGQQYDLQQINYVKSISSPWTRIGPARGTL